MNEIIILGVICTLIAIMGVMAIALLMSFSLQKQMSRYIGKLENVISVSKNDMHVAMEHRLLDNHFLLIMMVVFLEIEQIRKDGDSFKMTDRIFEDILTAWVFSKTKINTTYNYKQLKELLPLTKPLFMDFAMTGKITPSDDNAFEFDSDKDNKIFLSNRDFMREVLVLFNTANMGKKTFFK